MHEREVGRGRFGQRRKPAIPDVVGASRAKEKFPQRKRSSGEGERVQKDSLIASLGREKGKGRRQKRARVNP